MIDCIHSIQIPYIFSRFLAGIIRFWGNYDIANLLILDNGKIKSPIHSGAM